jgi:hypothetical protein
MRTTLTLDPDVAHLIEDEVHRRRAPKKQIVNEAIRRGLSEASKKKAAKQYKVKPFHSQLQPGIDPNRLSEIAQEMEDEEMVARMFRRKRPQ